MSREAYKARSEFYYKNYYGQLEGATIEKFLGFKNEDEEITFDGDEGFPTFQVKLASGEIQEFQVSMDEEGNGAGFLFLPYEPLMDGYDKAHKLNQYAEKK